MKPSRRMTLARMPNPVRTPTLGGVVIALCLSAGCGAPAEVNDNAADPESAVELAAQSARVPQATRIDPATAFAGASPLLTITGRNFTPDLRVYIDNAAVPILKVVSTTQVQVQLPATITTLGKKLVRVENSLTYRGTERDDLFSLSPDPIALMPLDQVLDAPTAKLVAAGDANGDGKPDAFVLSSDGTSLRLYLSTGRAPMTALPGITSYSGLQNFALGDINGDGKLDVVGISGISIVAWLGDGTGKFTATGISFITTRLGGIDSLQGTVALADVTGDGKLDVCYGTRLGELVYATGKGDGTFIADSLLWRNPVGWPSHQPHQPSGVLFRQSALRKAHRARSRQSAVPSPCARRGRTKGTPVYDTTTLDAPVRCCFAHREARWRQAQGLVTRAARVECTPTGPTSPPILP